MLAYDNLRRWTNIKPAFECFIFAALFLIDDIPPPISRLLTFGSQPISCFGSLPRTVVNLFPSIIHRVSIDQ